MSPTPSSVKQETLSELTLRKVCPERLQPPEQGQLCTCKLVHGASTVLVLENTIAGL